MIAADRMIAIQAPSRPQRSPTQIAPISTGVTAIWGSTRASPQASSQAKTKTAAASTARPRPICISRRASSLRVPIHSRGGATSSTPSRSPTRKAAMVVATGWLGRVPDTPGHSHSQKPAVKDTSVGASTAARPKGIGAIASSDRLRRSMKRTSAIIRP